MATILVTGGVGFIGHHLVRELISRGNRVIIVDNLSNANKSFLTELRESDKFQKDIILRKLDIRNGNLLADIFKKEAVETCIHLAAKISVKDSITQPRETLDVNVNGTLNVLEACCNSNVSNFIYASSAAVYGDPQTLPIPEEHIIRPISPYGASKAAWEALVSSYSSRIKNCNILRFFNIYGKGQTETYAGVITQFIQRLSNNLPPVINGDGSQTRDFVHISDVIKAIVSAQANIDPNQEMDLSANPGIFNIGTGTPTNIQHLACLLIDVFGLQGKIRPVYSEPIPGDISHSYADIGRAKKALNFRPDRDLKTTLIATLA